jgi:hypothetical protein
MTTLNRLRKALALATAIAAPSAYLVLELAPRVHY